MRSVGRVDLRLEPYEIRLVFLDQAHTGSHDSLRRGEISLGHLPSNDGIRILARSVGLAHIGILALLGIAGYLGGGRRCPGTGPTCFTKLASAVPVK